MVGQCGWDDFPADTACSSCSPGLCTAPEDAANVSSWCEHALGSEACSATAVICALWIRDPCIVSEPAAFGALAWARLLMISVALPLHFSDIHPMNTDLYTFSFLLFTSGRA